MIEAIKAMQHEGTKSEVAQGFKERGNEMVAEKKWKDAKEFYTQGIAVLGDKSEDKWDKAEDDAAEERQRTTLEEQLYVNRALCNLELSMAAWLPIAVRASLTRQKTIDLRRWIVLRRFASTLRTSRRIIGQRPLCLRWTRSWRH